MGKPRVIIVDWKSYVESNPKGSLVYKRLYQPLEENFECIPVFSEDEIPEDILQNGTHALVIHPSGKYIRMEILEDKILKFILSSYPDMYRENWATVEKQNVQFVQYSPESIKSALESSLR